MLRRRLPLILGLALVALLAVVCVPPALAGPAVECSGTSQAECDEAVLVVVKEAIAGANHPIPLPITGVRLSYDQCGLSYVVTWLFGFNWGYSGLC